RVTTFALALAEAAGVPAAERALLQRGGILHDIGKISIPDAILNKPGPLTPEERAVIEQHPAQGVKIIEPPESLRAAVPLIRWHHERLDGRGYPHRPPGGRDPAPGPRARGRGRLRRPAERAPLPRRGAARPLPGDPARGRRGRRP